MAILFERSVTDEVLHRLEHDVRLHRPRRRLRPRPGGPFFPRRRRPDEAVAEATVAQQVGDDAGVRSRLLVDVKVLFLFLAFDPCL